MNGTSGTVALTSGARWGRWLPRGLALAFTAFLSLFAFDAFDGIEGAFERAVALALHLVPSGLCLALVALAWKRPWIGAAGFGILALAYAGVARAHPNWILVISGPLVLVALAYLVDARLRAVSRGA